MEILQVLTRYTHDTLRENLPDAHIIISYDHLKLFGIKPRVKYGIVLYRLYKGDKNHYYNILIHENTCYVYNIDISNRQYHDMTYRTTSFITALQDMTIIQINLRDHEILNVIQKFVVDTHYKRQRRIHDRSKLFGQPLTNK